MAAKKSTTEKKSRAKTPAKGRKARGKKGTQPEPRPGLSLERKLDIAGVALVLAAVLTLLGFFSPNRSGLLQTWHNLWAGAFGIGAIGFPLGVGAAGLWLVLRHFGDRLPQIAPERVIGVLLLYLAFLATAHFLIAPEIDFRLAGQGQGGGLLGALILSALFSLLGQVASAVVLAAAWVVGLMLTASLSAPELVRWIAARLGRLRRPTQPAAGGTRHAPLPARDRPPAPPPPPGPGAPSPAPGSAPPAAPGPGRGTFAPAALPSVKEIEKKEKGRNAELPIPPPPPRPDYGAAALIIGDDQHWELPAVEEMLEVGVESTADDKYDRDRARTIEETLASFGAPATVKEINRGPTITQFCVEPEMIAGRGGKQTRVKVGKISALANDLALALAATSIRIEAPVPGKGYVGIEVPNTETSLVALRDVMESESFRRIQSPLRLGLGQDVSGQAVCADLAAMPHLLVAGTTGSGKSVCVNSIIACLLLNNTPEELKLLMVDPKRVELTTYNGIPHLLAPVVVDLERVVASLQWVAREMDERYRQFARAGARNIADHNARMFATGEKKLPYLVVVIDELADLMMLAPDETERIIARLAQLARATGIHLIISTQRPSVDVITGLIKANFPARISFAVASSVDSRVVLDQPGAERLLGRGDMLFQSPDAAAPLRMQGVYVSDAELLRIVRYWKGVRSVGEVAPLPAAAAPPPPPADLKQAPLWEELAQADSGPGADGQDELLEEAIRAVRELKKASISLLQRRLRIGYTRAARLIDLMEEMGVVGPAQSGALPREVLDYGEDAGPLPISPGETRTWQVADGK